ncbi:hypothetical protein EON82_00380 [bacterium]|nr:MAG: hypothetical protein EON82_00380 [bacterium]
MRLAIAIVGLVFAAGFLSVVFLYPPPSGATWPLYLCAGFCLLISMACLEGPAGRLAGRIIGGSVCLAYLAYLVGEIRTGNWFTPRQSGTSALNALLGLAFYGVPGGSYALTGRFWPFGKTHATVPFTSMEFEEELHQARGNGLVLCRWAETTRNADLYEAIADVGPDLLEQELDAVDPETAHKFTLDLLRHEHGGDRTVMSEPLAEAYCGQFFDAVRGSDGILEAWILEADREAALVLRSTTRTAILAVDDGLLDDDDDDDP